MKGHKLWVNWLNSNIKEWETINGELRLICNAIKGSEENKLAKIGNLIYGREKLQQNPFKFLKDILT